MTQKPMMPGARDKYVPFRPVPVTDRQWPRGLHTKTEQEFAFPLDESLTIRGRIDRLDSTSYGLGFVIYYKYSNAHTTKKRL